MRTTSVLIAVLLLGIVLPSESASAQVPLQVACHADLPVQPGQVMTWRATVDGSVGPITFAWSGADGLAGSDAVTTHTYPSVGYVVAHVEVTDTSSSATADCAMHVVPSSYVERPSVTPVLWVPAGVDPAPMVPELKRVWRAIHATFFHLYGRTFLMRPLTTVVSASSEQDLCGGDCTDAGKADVLVNKANEESAAAIGGTIPYTRAMLVMAWGAGAWAGAYGWDIARGTIGDVAIAPAADQPIPAIEPDLPDWLVQRLGLYDYAVYNSIAHELNHVIGWDDPHDFSLDNPPNDYERAVSLAGPFLTRKLRDRKPSLASFTQPDEDAVISGMQDVTVDATDDVAMDAVLLLVDQHLVAIDRSAPFSFPLDTRELGFGSHRLTAVALDTQGNMTEVTRNVRVENILGGGSCSTRYPLGTFHACFYDGVGTTGTYLGALVDHPFPLPAPNAGFGIDHAFVSEIAFGKASQVTGVWRGRIDLPTDTYLFRFFADDGLRVWVDGHLIVDAWTAPQVADFAAAVAASGPTRVKIAWFQADGGAGVRFWWSPTRQSPSA